MNLRDPEHSTTPDGRGVGSPQIVNVLLAFAAITLSGCAHSLTISADPNSIVREPGLPPLLETKVGYFIPPASLSLEVETAGGGGDSVKYYPYRDLEPAFKAMLGNVYSGVTKLGNAADSIKMISDNIKYIISPRVHTTSSSSSSLRWPPTNFTFDLTCDIREAEGKISASPRVVGAGQYIVPTIVAGTDVGTPGKRAMYDALIQMQRMLLEMNYSGPVVRSPPLKSGAVGSEELRIKSTGTGAIITSNGYVLTAAHVVSGAKEVKVLTAKGMKTATIQRVDEANDIAVIRLQEGDYQALAIAPSKQIRLGQSVATIGFPNINLQGFSPKVTKGEISSINGYGDDPRLWQISVPVQPGNSGGPLLDESGNLVGIIVAKFGLKAAMATGDLPQNVSYAVKSAYALALVDPYLNDTAPKPKLGISESFTDLVSRIQDSVVLVLVY